jgi:uncharacterized glyoxalase superfamily protein PhnB
MAPSGWTPLHQAARQGDLATVRRLLGEGANPNARETGDNTYPLHWAAARGHTDIARALLDAGGDVHGTGDVHELDVIGWATVFHEPAREGGGMDDARRELVALLLERGASHHVFSAMAMGDLDLIREVARQDPPALARRMSRFERGMTPLHFALDRNRHDMLDLLISLGADLEAQDLGGRTALAVAMLRDDRKAMQRLHAAGAKPPKPTEPPDFTAAMSALADSVRRNVPMISVPDVASTLAWYRSIGFVEVGRNEDEGEVNWASLACGNAKLMLTMHGKPGSHDVSLWFYTDEVDRIYELFRNRQLRAAEAALTGQPGAEGGIQFVQDIENMFYGARQFGIRDPNGYELYFIMPIERSPD